MKNLGLGVLSVGRCVILRFYRLNQTTCINVVNCKEVTQKCQVFFAVSVRNRGVFAWAFPQETPPTTAQIFYIGVGNSGFPTTYSIYYTTFVVFVSNFSSKKIVVPLGFASLYPTYI